MSATKNINWQIGLLEARTGKGSSFKRAKQVEEKRRREQEKAQKRAKAGAGPSSEPQEAPEAEPNANCGATGEAEEKLRVLRSEKAKTKMFHIRRQLRIVTKKVQSFEMQKATRQLKNARMTRDTLDKEGEGADQEKREAATKAAEEAEKLLEQIKAVDLGVAVELAVNRMKKKSYDIRIALADAKEESISHSLNDDRAMQRVLNSKQMAAEVKKHIEDLEAVLKGAVKPKRAALPTKSTGPVVADKSGDDYAEDSGSERDISDIGDSGSGHDSDGYESTSDLDGDAANSRAPQTSKKAKISSGDSMFVGSLGDFVSDDDISGSESESESHDNRKSKAKGRKETPGKRKGKDAFRYDEDEGKAFDDIYGANVRKNRPGQRARRMMYEKKYGKEANHVKLLAKDKKPKAGAERPDKANSKLGHKHKAGPKNGDGNSTNTAPMHPSWEAKRRERQMLASAPKSKKIVFGDDGSVGSTAPQDPKPKSSQPEHLHPSWEAKRRQKEIMEQAKSVKGTKIVFD
ncbi:hypothetical protein GQ54DRAFT_298533 [Martensiomyces pterosporus]|nr:hypothetical protein GQ54DRAFT_298533 [Martensiomyces pterosporus]